MCKHLTDRVESQCRSSFRTKAAYVCAAIVALAVSIAIAAPYQSYKKDHCEWCGAKSGRLVVHHIVPQHIAPDLADDHPENYITLCDPMLFRKSGCHWKIGHRGQSWTNDNSVMVNLIVEQLKKEIDK